MRRSKYVDIDHWCRESRQWVPFTTCERGAADERIHEAIVEARRTGNYDIGNRDFRVSSAR